MGVTHGTFHEPLKPRKASMDASRRQQFFERNFSEKILQIARCREAMGSRGGLGCALSGATAQAGTLPERASAFRRTKVAQPIPFAQSTGCSIIRSKRLT